MTKAATYRFLETAPAQGAAPPVAPSAPKPARLVSLDAYRGFIMLLMASGGLSLGYVATSFPDSHAWKVLAFHTDHVPWAGGTLLDLSRQDDASEAVNRLGGWFGGSFWDLIQPSFMFMVGVAIPYSYASRRSRGDSNLRIWFHVFVRALILVALGIFLRSKSSRMTNFTFEDVLTQIGLGYPIVFGVFLLGRRSGVWPMVYVLALAAILGGYWAYFAYYPQPGPDFDYKSVGVPNGPWPWKAGLFANWDKNSNAAQWFDVWFLNLFFRPKPWEFNGGGYLTLNFIPSMATAVFGLVAGDLLRGSWSKAGKFIALVALGVACLAGGAYAGETVCPIVKRIWTPSWAVYSAGWTFLLLALFYGIIDCVGFRWWAFPFVVVGMNSITMYCMAGLIAGWVRDMLRIHVTKPLNWLFEWANERLPDSMHVQTGSDWYSFAGVYGPVVQSATVLFVLWLICLWMYRRGIFIRI